MPVFLSEAAVVLPYRLHIISSNVALDTSFMVSVFVIDDSRMTHDATASVVGFNGWRGL